MGFVKGQRAWNKGKTNKSKQVCKFCKKMFLAFHSEIRRGSGNFCSRKCYFEESKISRRGNLNPCWKGGRRFDKGYVWISQPNHPCATKTGYIYEHRLIMEKQLGRLLKVNEIIHHINGNKSDNRPENLLVMTQSEHMKEHWSNWHDLA